MEYTVSSNGFMIPLNVGVVLITPPPVRLFCAGRSWGRVWGQGGNNKPLAVSGDCSKTVWNCTLRAGVSAELHSAGWGFRRRIFFIVTP